MSEEIQVLDTCKYCRGRGVVKAIRVGGADTVIKCKYCMGTGLRDTKTLVEGLEKELGKALQGALQEYYNSL